MDTGSCPACLSNEDVERVLFSIQTHESGEWNFCKEGYIRKSN